MAQTLCGEWGGEMDYSYINDDGESRSTDVYYTTMKFFQYNQNSKSYSGEGVETDYLLDSQGNVIEDKSQTLDFSCSYHITEECIITLLVFISQMETSLRRTIV